VSALLLAAGTPSPPPPASSGPLQNPSAGSTGQLPPLHLPHVEFHFLIPFLLLSGGALGLLLVTSLVRPVWRRGLYAAWTTAFAVAAAVWAWHLWGQVVGHGRVPHPGAGTAVVGAVAVDGFALFITITVCAALVLGAVLAESYLPREGLEGPEYYVLAMLSASGAVLMGSANDLVIVFLGLEVLSLPLYVLAAFHRYRARSGEAGMKYFVLGAFSSAFFLYGIALAYGATGTTSLAGIATFLANHVLPSNAVLLAGMALLIVGMGFKVAAVPFQWWSPDVYQGAPTPATGFMAAVAKIAGFAALFRILLSAFPTQADNWRPLIWALAVLTMVAGSVLAVVQNDVKRILAYSSIAHAGYVLVALEAATATGSISRNGLAGGSFYLLAYTFVIVGSFAVVTVVGGRGDTRHGIDAYRGLAARQPVLALCFTVLLLSQAGIPFTTGFVAKFDVISAAVARGHAPDYVLGVIAMLAAAIGVSFYLRIVLAMYQSPSASEEGPGDLAGGDAAGGGVAGGGVVGGGDGAGAGAGAAPVAAGGGGVAVAAPARVAVPATVAAVIGVSVVFTVAFGIFPGPIVHFAERATLLF
jgi:NADH-quinone oxidoreductase subunit N